MSRLIASCVLAAYLVVLATAVAATWKILAILFEFVFQGGWQRRCNPWLLSTIELFRRNHG